MLAALIDDKWRIQVRGFYDGIVEMTDEERNLFAGLNFDDDAYRKKLGIDATLGEEGFTTLERRWARPTSIDCGAAITGRRSENGFACRSRREVQLSTRSRSGFEDDQIWFGENPCRKLPTWN